MKYPYELIDSATDKVVGRYRSLSICCEDGQKKNDAYHGDRVSHRPYFVRRVKNGSKIVV